MSDGFAIAWSPARWVALRHGLSKNGNDHIHIAASRVREDGTKVSIHNDFIRAQRIARELEQEHGLEPLEGEQTRTAARGYSEPARVTLEREVRAASIASVDEAEFVRRMRAADVLVRPRYASDRTDVVAGYSVALRPQQGSGEGPVWYGGGRLARDLTLPALRQSWPDTPEAAGAAVAEWNAANRHRRVAAPGRERQVLDGKRWDAATQRLQLMNDRLAQIPVQDRGRWAELARDGAGTLAAWSRTAPKEMRPQLAQAASVLGRSAQLRQAPRRRVQSESPFAGAALVLAAATRGPQSRAAELAMMQQMIMFARAIVQMHRAMRDMRTATALQDGVASRLQAIYEQQPRPVAVAAGRSRVGPQDAPQAIPEHIRQAREGLTAPTRIRSPLPAKITPRPDVDEQQRRRPDKSNAPER
ncbi:relaxase/mobilization nuclease domain-containing protein [Agrococcus sp. Ld7]|uniref:relaxase/mobilization nuclease domain-containing protein n=1 Tax=Agrococcus sp. Ld7 TaxID=649148 RepID=UPI00386DB9CE